MTSTTDFQLVSFLYMMITKGPHANYDGTQQCFKVGWINYILIFMYDDY